MYATLITYMPEERNLGAIAQVSRNKGYATGRDEGAEKTLRFCMKAGHLSVLEFAQIVYRIECPIYVARQLMRYRTASYVERSLRYCEPDPADWMKRAEDPEFVNTRESDILYHEECCQNLYHDLIAKGMKKETARAVLPLSTSTVFLMRIDLRNLLHIFDERLTPYCQHETREIVTQMKKIATECFPIVMEEYDANH